jgi:heme exporter protein B
MGLSALLWRDLRLSLRRPNDVVVVLVFFSIVVSLFPLGVGADPKILHSLGAGVVWVAALLASLLSLPRLFLNDYQDGTLEGLLLSPTSLAELAGIKIFAHWLSTGVPLALVSPLLGLQFGLSMEGLETLFLSVLLGTPCLSLIGAIGAALTLGVRSGPLLMALIVLPLNIPVLILGAGSIDAVEAGLGASAHLSLLGALLLASLMSAPFAIAASLRISLD